LEGFVNRREDSAEKVEGEATVLADLAAHEPQHIVLTLAGLDSGDVVEAAQGDSPTVNDLLPGIVKAVNEYQCELAANTIIVSSFPHDSEAVSRDRYFREPLQKKGFGTLRRRPVPSPVWNFPHGSHG
jgi:hypothetical protein